MPENDAKTAHPIAYFIGQCITSVAAIPAAAGVLALSTLYPAYHFYDKYIQNQQSDQNEDDESSEESQNVANPTITTKATLQARKNDNTVSIVTLDSNDDLSAEQHPQEHGSIATEVSGSVSTPKDTHTKSNTQQLILPEDKKNFKELFMTQMNTYAPEQLDKWDIDPQQNASDENKYIIKSSRKGGTYEPSLDVTVCKNNVSAILAKDPTEDDMIHLAKKLVCAALAEGQKLDQIHVHGGNEFIRNALFTELKERKKMALEENKPQSPQSTM